MIHTTNELWLAACFELDGQPVTEITLDHAGRRAKFILEVEEQIGDFTPQEYEDAYYDNELSVPPQQLRQKVRELSSRLARAKKKLLE